MIKTIGVKLKGAWERSGGLTTYYMTEEEISQRNSGKIAIVGVVIYEYNSDGSATKTHENTIINMDFVKKVDIFYDIEDDYMMNQTFELKDGSTVFGKSRDHDEVKKWEKNGVMIIKSYGY